MKYRHKFLVKAPLAEVAEFHSQSASMGDITPPPAVVKVHQAPVRLSEGDEMEFTIWLGPLPVRWQARIEEVSPTGFVDRQIQGPFRRWTHRHNFEPVDEQTTEVVDEIEFKLAKDPIRGIVGLGMTLSLPFLFAYRGWKTRRLLTDRETQNV
jgi:ligand-binding SRPBCC domain-containing protein